MKKGNSKEEAKAAFTEKVRLTRSKEKMKKMKNKLEEIIMKRKTNIFNSKRFTRITRRASAILAAAIAMSCVAASTVSATNANPVKAEIAKTQLSFPLPEFPADGKTYFNVSGTSGCTSHSGCNIYGGCSCLSYASSIQCAGFAVYAFDRYSHMSSSSSWSVAAGDRHKNPNYPNKRTSPAELKEAIQSLPIGSYVRLAKTTYDPTINGHSFVIVSTDNNGVTVYEANRSGDCKVQIKYYTYEDLYKDYNYLYETVYHNYSNIETYNSSYHKTMCTTSGCSGYILESHSFTGEYSKYDAGYHKKTCSKSGCYALEVHNFQLVGGKYVCKQCKYTTTSSAGVASVEDDR